MTPLAKDANPLVQWRENGSILLSPPAVDRLVDLLLDWRHEMERQDLPREYRTAHRNCYAALHALFGNQKMAARLQSE